MALAGAKWFALQSDGGHQTPFWDEHAFDQQRFFNVLCLVYGSAPDRFGRLLADGALPEARARRCPREWTSIKNAWDGLLAPHQARSRAPSASPSPPVPAEGPSCDEVSRRVTALVAERVRGDLEKLPPGERAAAAAELDGRLARVGESIQGACRERGWSADGRACLVAAASLDDADRCPIPR
jgi:hypothetical protein